MIKKIILLIIILSILIISVFVLNINKTKYTYLLENENYKHIVLSNIKSIEKIRYTEAGDNHTIIDNEADINTTYNYLKSIQIGKETNMSCEDNTTVYSITLKDNSKALIEIECDWVIINNKRYLIKGKY